MIAGLVIAFQVWAVFVLIMVSLGALVDSRVIIDGRTTLAFLLALFVIGAAAGSYFDLRISIGAV